MTPPRPPWLGGPRGCRHVVAAVAIGALGCRRFDALPGDPPGPRDLSTAPPAPSSPVAPAASAAASAAAPSAPPFGPWVRCYAHFRPTSTPRRDLTRLALLCGPPNGMRAASAVVEGEVSADAAPREHPISLEKGQCVRVFAVADEGVADLDLALHAPSGERLAADGIDDRWPVLLPDRPVCAAVTGVYHATVRAVKGAGRYALQPWLLP